MPINFIDCDHLSVPEPIAEQAGKNFDLDVKEVTVHDKPYYRLDGDIEDEGLGAEDVVDLLSKLAQGNNPYGEKPDYMI